MITQLFSIYDTKARVYEAPYTFNHFQEAVRAFANCVNHEGHKYNTNPEDYTIYHIGEYDTSKGSLLAQDPKLLYSGLQLIKYEEPGDKQNEQQITNGAPIQPST